MAQGAAFSPYPFLGLLDDQYGRGASILKSQPGPNFNIFDIISQGYQPGSPGAFYDAYPRETMAAQFGTPTSPGVEGPPTDPRWRIFEDIIRASLTADEQRLGKQTTQAVGKAAKDLYKQYGLGTPGDGGRQTQTQMPESQEKPNLPTGGGTEAQEGVTPSPETLGVVPGVGSLGVDPGAYGGIQNLEAIMSTEGAGLGVGQGAGSAAWDIPYLAIAAYLANLGYGIYERSKSGISKGEQAADAAVDAILSPIPVLGGTSGLVQELIADAFRGSKNWRNFAPNLAERLNMESEGINLASKGLAGSQSLGDVAASLPSYQVPYSKEDEAAAKARMGRMTSDPQGVLADFINSGGNEEMLRYIYPDLPGAGGKKHEGRLEAGFGQGTAALREALPEAVTAAAARQYDPGITAFARSAAGATDPTQLQESINALYGSVYQNPLNLKYSSVPGWDIGTRFSAPIEWSGQGDPWMAAQPSATPVHDIPRGYGLSPSVEQTNRPSMEQINAAMQTEGGLTPKPEYAGYNTVTSVPQDYKLDTSRFANIPQVSAFGAQPDLASILPDIPGIFDPGIINTLRDELGSAYGEMTQKTNPFTGRMGLPIPASAGGNPQSSKGSVGGTGGGGLTGDQDKLANAIADAERFLSEG